MGLFKYYDDSKFDLVFKETSLSMRLSQVDALNDPFEAKLDIKSVMEQKSKEFLDGKQVSEEEHLKIKEIKKNELEKSENEFRKIINSHYGILSLTTNNLNRLMWSHYTNSYKGFCIELDIELDKINKKNEYLRSEINEYNVFAKKVDYAKAPLKFDPKIVDNYILSLKNKKNLYR